MAMNNSGSASRQYEGPPELLQEGVNKRDIFTRKDMPGGKSVADAMTERYGEQGVGWDVDSDRYANENELKNELHAPEFNLAQEALRNMLKTGRYELDDGTNVTGKLHSYVREADKVDLIRYPDGKIHEDQKFR
jgi:hypothetical protein